MKKLSFLFVFLLIAHMPLAQAATQKVRKIPFLPYAGMSNIYYGSAGGSSRGGSSASQPFRSQPIYKPYETVFFEEDSAQFRADQYAKLKRVANRLSREGSYFYTVVTFTSPEIDSSLAHARAQALISAMEDYGIKGEPTISNEYKAHPVLNPHRVEVYMKPQGLGTTIRK